MKIGILGGTFNPIHNGHLTLATQVKQKLGLDIIIFVPASFPPHKENSEIILPSDRLNMVKLAIKNNKDFAVSDIEIKRGGRSYTIDTLRQFRRIYRDDELYFITGSDLIKYLDDWKDIKDVFRLAKFVVAKRPQYPFKNLPKEIYTLSINSVDISAYQIRKLIKEGKSIKDLVPKPVDNYIREKKLYTRRILVAPSIIAADFSNLGADIRKVEKAQADMLHLDIMDGHFVNNITLGPLVVKSIRKVTKMPLEAHLMITNPLRYLSSFVKAGADIITVHIETISNTQLKATSEELRKMGIEFGVSLNPPTPLKAISSILDYVDMVLVMTVNPGFSGQKFMASVLPKIRQLRKIYTGNIAVDGGITDKNAKAVIRAGADILASGSFIFNASDTKEAIRRLRNERV